jgi:phosphoribosylformimino-5-aminoimidazole carboxamide ribotide isomerase
VELIPAIDLLGGRVVRLARGDYDAVTEYGDDPLEVARDWQRQGARRLHLVDLDGAREGRPVQGATIAELVAAVDIPCQVAGGLRTPDDARAALAAGADRVVLGSALIADPSLASMLVNAHGPERIIAAVDVRDGRALGDGWVADARGADATAHVRALAHAGIRRFAVTAIARDGMLEGPDIALLDAVRDAARGAAIIASGGVSRLEDIEALARDGFEAAILGRALYDGAIDLREALAAAAGDRQRRR